MLTKIVKYHKDWIKIAISLLRSKEEAEDLIQEMYIRLHNYNIKIDDIKYKQEVNRYFIYTVIRNLALQKIRKRHFVDNIDDLVIPEENNEYLINNQPLLNASWMCQGKRGCWDGTKGYWFNKNLNIYII